jgi:O-antigen ligase
VLGWLAVIAVVVGVAFAPLLGSRVNQQFETSHATGSSSHVPQTIGYRYQVWQDEFAPLLSGRLLTGYGPDLPPQLNFPFTESLYITLLMRGGIPLLLVYAALMCAFAAAGARAARSDEPERSIAGRVLVVCIGVLLFIHLLESYFVDSGPPHLLWLLAALMVPAAAREERRRTFV